MTSCLQAGLSELDHWHRQGNRRVIKLLMPDSVRVGGTVPSHLLNHSRVQTYLSINK